MTSNGQVVRGVTADECVLIAAVVAVAARECRRSGSTLPARVLELAAALQAAAAPVLDERHVLAAAVVAGFGTAPVPRLDAAGSAAPASAEWLTVAQAAELVKISPRGIRKAIAKGRLRGQSIARGAWRIDPASVHTMAVSRTAARKEPS